MNEFAIEDELPAIAVKFMIPPVPPAKHTVEDDGRVIEFWIGDKFLAIRWVAMTSQVSATILACFVLVLKTI